MLIPRPLGVSYQVSFHNSPVGIVTKLTKLFTAEASHTFHIPGLPGEHEEESGVSWAEADWRTKGRRRQLVSSG